MYSLTREVGEMRVDKFIKNRNQLLVNCIIFLEVYSEKDGKILIQKYQTHKKNYDTTFFSV